MILRDLPGHRRWHLEHSNNPSSLTPVTSDSNAVQLSVSNG